MMFRIPASIKLPALTRRKDKDSKKDVGRPYVKPVIRRYKF